MNIEVNGKSEQAEEGISLLEYILSKGLNPDTVVVEHNYSIVKKENQQNTYLKENDNLEILRFVGGG